MPHRLDFQSVLPRNEKWPWDLVIFLYPNSLYAAKPYRLTRIRRGDYGKPRRARLPLLYKIHEILEYDLSSGGSYSTLDTRIRALIFFYKFCDAQIIDPPNEPTALIRIFQAWVIHDSRPGVEASGSTLYRRAQNVATILARATDARVRQFMTAANMYEPPRPKRATSRSEERRLIDETSNFVRHLVDLIESLSHDSINGELPIEIKFRSGARFLHYSRRRSPETLRRGVSQQAIHDRWKQRERLLRSSQPFDRRPVINLRLEAELLLFISQTGMNLSQAIRYTTCDFSYSSHNDGYQVRRRYKDRRRGEVEFSIFSEYRKYFDAYLSWRQTVLTDPNDLRLFPFIIPKSSPEPVWEKRSFSLRKVFSAINVSFVGPQRLRNDRVNWLLRRSGDPNLVADMAQHSTRTLQEVYRRHDRSKIVDDLTSFWRQTDPTLQPPGPGKCVDAHPQSLPTAPNSSPQPDCIGAAGCLFCTHHRDVADFDYVWALASYRHLKSIELASEPAPLSDEKPSPAMMVVDRITRKFAAMRELGESFPEWIEEALTRIREESFHPDWSGLIDSAEAA